MKESDLVREERELIEVYREIPDKWKDKAIDILRIFTKDYSEGDNGKR